MQRGFARVMAARRHMFVATLTTSARWESQQADPASATAGATASAEVGASSASASQEAEGSATTQTRAGLHMDFHAARSTMDRAAAARGEIAALWRQCSESEARSRSTTSPPQEEADAGRLAAVQALLDKYNIDVTTSREEDVCRGLGDALDRLLLLCVPLAPASASSTDMLERVLNVSARQGRKLSMRTVQHLFARTNSFAEALAIFYALRQCHFAMSIEAYHAMLYSLQRLEEEGWAERFHDEYVESKNGFVSEQALDFVLRGVDNQLLPENKPWLGRVMFAETEDAAAQKQSLASYDEMGKLWVNRYKGSESV